ncbi:MAG: TonB-dependent receptor, partial [Acidobacteriaceae bacterium]|nr:TonB-dependent receptor [Acidobacteriaceae bacterium]
EYLQNRHLNAVDSTIWTQGLNSNPRFDNNHLGATVGGPILRNKLFYFGNFEYNPLGMSATPGQVIYAPTAAGYSALQNVSGLSSTNFGVLKKYLPAAPTADQGAITVGGTQIPIGSLSFVSPAYANTYAAVLALDYNMSDKDQIRGRWIYNRTDGLDTAASLPVFFTDAPYTNQLVSLTEFHTFSPTLQNEFRVSFSRDLNRISAGSATFPGLTAFPNITIDDLQLQLGPSPNTPTGFIQNVSQIQDSATKVLGRHTLKAGFHFTDLIMPNYFVQRVRGDYEYGSLEQFLMDRTPNVFGERSAGPNSYPAGFLQNEAFLNDDIRLRPNLTLNLGVRYEYVTTPIAWRYQSYSAPASVPGGITFAAPQPSPNEWSPRIGLAWSPGSSGKWSLRAGFSRAFDLMYGNLIAGSAPPYFQTTQDVDLSANAPGFLAGGGLPGVAQPLPGNPVAARSIISTYSFGGKRPYGLTWTGSVQRQIGKDYILEARYTGTKGVHLWTQTRLNIASKVTPSLYLPTYFSMPSASAFASLGTTLAQIKAQPNNLLASYGFAGPVTTYAPEAYSSYNGLALQLTKRYHNNLSYIAAYTWSHLLDDATATNFSTYLTPRRAQDFQNLRAEWASSALDRRHRFTFTPMYDWNAFRQSRWYLKQLVSNWHISGTYTYESPEFATVQSNVDSNLNNDTAGDRSIVNPAGALTVGSSVTAYNASGQPVALGDPSTVAYVA